MSRSRSGSAALTPRTRFVRGLHGHWPAMADTARAEKFSTEFTHIAEAEDLAVLEWTSQATLAAGRPMENAGVSLLTFDGDDRVSRFATCYDTAAFAAPST